MRILIVSTLKRRVGPDQFASRSRVIYQLAEGLAKNGHHVDLLGTGDSQIPGVNIIPLIEKGWVDLPPVENEFNRQIANLMQLSKKIVEIQDSYEVIHNHTVPDFFPTIIEKDLHVPMLTTMHALYDFYVDDILSQYNKTYFISLSNAYANLYKKAKMFKTVYNGVDTDFYRFSSEKSDYLFWLGRMPKAKNADGTFMDPKGVRAAIKLAQKTGDKLYISAPVEDKKFFEIDVKPHLNDKIQFVGEVSSEQTVPVEKIIDLYQHAKAFIMTINQFEPFGLVLAEAMSCGTPVIGFDRGAVPEVIVDGKTGFVVPYEQGVEGLENALSKISQIKPEDCRKHVEENFSIQKMVENYEKVYEEITQK
ncbi:MAG TPA: glycosyltransferase family 4 protein [Candidatus Nitrosocosmicus sp.]|nr:glycosyltransferase family 4 protein [Candidatus Nitrosocosmicus sp.]